MPWSTWALRDVPARAQAWVLAVDAMGFLAALTAIAVWPPDLTGLVAAIPLAVGTVIGVECSRQVEQARGPRSSPLHKDFQTVWMLACALVLPLGLALPGVMLAYWLWRQRAGRCLPYRAVFSASMTALAVLASRAGYEALTAIGSGGLPPGVITAVAIAVAAVAYGLADIVITAVAIMLMEPRAPAGQAFGRPADLVIDAAALGLGGLVAAAALTTPWTALLGIPVVVMLQRSLLVAPLESEAHTDAKTGLDSIGWWWRQAEQALGRARRRSEPFAVLVIDIDHFKRINDSFGHPVGDEVLRSVAQLIRGAVRDRDLVGRYGGEEFVLALPGTAPSLAAQIAHRLRHRVAETPFWPYPEVRSTVPPATLTISVGYAACPRDSDDLDRLVRLADQALYAAKAAGRNEVRGCAHDGTDLPDLDRRHAEPGLADLDRRHAEHSAGADETAVDRPISA